ncbi:MAG: nucleoside-diphosphate sugar epimerase/dehydratase [Bacillota bacterium]|nr:nucleoside-diphosphate sugar epimerase/dehydratase [Bacillota bacterium]
MKNNKISLRGYLLYLYDCLFLIFSNLFFVAIYINVIEKNQLTAIFVQMFIGGICIFVCRYIGNIYKQVWRFGTPGAYLRLVLVDAVAGLIFVSLQLIQWPMRIPCMHAFSISVINLIMSLSVRLMYQYIYENAGRSSRFGQILRIIAKVFAGLEIKAGSPDATSVKNKKIKIAIVGAGRIGASLADDLLKNPRSAYQPCCFIDIDKRKIGREIAGIPVLSREEATQEKLDAYPIQEIVFAFSGMTAEQKKRLYEHYQRMGCKLKVYDYPMKQADGEGRRQLREFDIEELLFRRPLLFTDENTAEFYRNKTVLISGGGGSIGSELCRQIAKMHPQRIIILDVNENDTYDLQQSLRIAYGASLDLRVEIASVCDRDALDQIFAHYHPQVVLHAAAHKHVPLMEHNCCEAVKNNVFGTLNMVEVSEKYRVQKFIMISTDKAVNPTNVMGATKRMCEMIVQSRTNSGTKFSATRFGNVLGSNGSVIPLFKKQISSGGPVTLTDRRIIRYFMTIPEASQLVLQSGAMAKNGELYVLDMGKPIKILDLAENMIRLSGYAPYIDIDIVETGLRPGEKLYEELLIKNEELDKTANELIFVERDKPLEASAIDDKLAILREALATRNDDAVRNALKKAVPTYHDPKQVNASASTLEQLKSTEKAG